MSYLIEKKREGKEDSKNAQNLQNSQVMMNEEEKQVKEERAGRSSCRSLGQRHGFISLGFVSEFLSGKRELGIGGCSGNCILSGCEKVKKI